ncbi:MAG: ERAP1-like C-terminal domain-containing protein [Kordiimonadaceae bacterium]|nr:ERAP1-like C-terminal domain-containing protein [Kordiimonadaceae bacterium]
MKHIGLAFSFIFLFLTVNSSPVFAQLNEPLPITAGVSWDLAKFRKKNISDINYKIDLNIPALANVSISGSSEISFVLNDVSSDLQIDFTEGKENILSMRVNGRRQKVKHEKEHIIIDRDRLRIGKNIVKINYIAGNGALNRSPNFLYTLFVPDRMRTTLPVFDQPNLKATFELSLTIPENWESLSSAPVKNSTRRNLRKKIIFEKSDKMSTYLFSFVAGRFKKIVRNVDGLEMTMLHREPDDEKVERNQDEIFRLHKAALDYMEDYTGIKYPFKKFAFVLIPSFQFGGMEHVGAIQYKDTTIMLDKNPSQTDLLARAALIGHETSHMWFGDLVTMDWFNDVWTKEVFANFMSAKIVNPNFPEINHQLQAHLRLHPGAYAVDRSEGPNPIRQELSNLNEAGSMYGAIIYNKAPIMMRQLEALIGEDIFREGIREYLAKYAYSNATWPDLIDILDKRSPMDLKSWSEVWVNTSGRPVFNINQVAGRGLMLSQSDPDHLNRSWPQSFSLKKGKMPYEITYSDKPINLDSLGNNNEDTVLANADGMGYGLFPITKDFIKINWADLSDLERAAAFVNLYEQLMEGNGVISPAEFLDLLEWAMPRENNPLIINHLQRQLSTIFWSLLDKRERETVAPALERIMWQEINDHRHDAGVRRIYFRNFANIAITADGIEKVRFVWDKSLAMDDLNLATRDYTNMAANLAIRLPDQANELIEAQKKRINGPDNQARFEFLQYALSPDQTIRDKFFDALSNKVNRDKEPWVLTALGYLHHPLRNGASEKYLKKSLELLEEIQATGDIFFPGRWVTETFEFYHSDNAVKTVRDFLSNHPDYNHQLKLKILQGADQMFRANKIIKNQFVIESQ